MPDLSTLGNLRDLRVYGFRVRFTCMSCKHEGFLDLHSYHARKHEQLSIEKLQNRNEVRFLLKTICGRCKSIAFKIDILPPELID